jgi:sporulation protein YlmC with PRC-barrel domain
MKNLTTFLAVAMMLSASTGGVALAQGKTQNVTIVDVRSINTGYRASKVIGSDVQNDAGTKIGTIDDLLIAKADFVPYAILSVGGFLGVGSKLVAVPYRSLQARADGKSFAFPGGTQDALNALPEFKYAD